MQPIVSLTMIVKDEESNLPKCLSTVADLVNEIVVVDTGSTDRTREIAGEFGARVVDFAWVDDFSAARNESLRHATGRWILWLDADEWLADQDRQRLSNLLARVGDENHGYIMQQFCSQKSSLAGPPRSVDQIVPQVRLFPSHPEIRWQHRVYEQIAGGVRRIGGDLRQTDIVIQHPGYEDAELHRRKTERNLRLARLELADHPDDPYVSYTLGVFLQMLGNNEESLTCLQDSLRSMRPGSSYGPKLFALITQALDRTGHPHEALALCQVGRDRYPEDNDLRTQETIIQPGAGDAAGAESFLQGRLASQHGPYPPIVERDLRTFARHHLAMLYRAGRRASDAERLWREALAESPRFAVGWLELGELYLSLGRWPELEDVLRRLEIHLGRTEDGAVLRARGHLARREFTAARELLEKVILLVPRSVRPRQALSHVLLFEGRDPAAAERALHDVLELDPGDQQALQNLALLRSQRAAGQVARPTMAVGQGTPVKSRLNIVFVHKEYPGQYGHVAHILAERHGYECTFVYGRLPARYQQALAAGQQVRLPVAAASSMPTGGSSGGDPVERGVRMVQYHARGASTQTHPCGVHFEISMWNNQAILEAMKARPDIRPDLIVGHSHFGTALFLADLYQCPLITYCEYFYRPRGSELDFRPEFPPSEDDRLVHRTYNGTTLLNLDASAACISPTQWQRSMFPTEYQPKIHTIFDGIDRSFWYRREPLQKIAGQPISRETKVVTYVSYGFEPTRGFDVFMKVAKRICDARDDVIFVVVGSDQVYYGQQLRDLKAPTFREHVLAADRYDLNRFIFTGQVLEEDLVKILSRSDLHLYLTVPFVLSWSLMNALACGCTLLASDTAPVREMVRHEQNGLLAGFNDVDGLAREALRVLADPGLFRSLGEAGVRSIDENYSVEATLPRLTALYDAVAMSRR